MTPSTNLIGRLKTGVSYLRDRKLLMISFLSGYNGRVGGKGEVDAGVRHQVCLELGQVHIEGAIKPKRKNNFVQSRIRCYFTCSKMTSYYKLPSDFRKNYK